LLTLGLVVGLEADFVIGFSKSYTVVERDRFEGDEKVFADVVFACMVNRGVLGAEWVRLRLIDWLDARSVFVGVLFASLLGMDLSAEMARVFSKPSSNRRFDRLFLFSGLI
jgi:hypothetical protein